MKIKFAPEKKPDGHKEVVSWDRLKRLLEESSKEHALQPKNEILEVVLEQDGLNVYWKNPVR